MMADALPFDPQTIVWFHAVNTIGSWRRTANSINNTMEGQQKAHGRVCFGIEVDVRVAYGGLEDETKSLVLAHDPLTRSVLETCGGDDDDKIHMALSDLIDQMSKLNRHVSGAETTTVFILKLDVKEVDGLPLLLDFLSGAYVRDAETRLFKFTEYLTFAPSQVWLNMDVVPLVPTQSNDEATVAECSVGVADAALMHFRRAIHLGMGLSLGWVIDPSFREWFMNEQRLHEEGPQSTRKHLVALRRGNRAMLTFLNQIFAVSEKDTLAVVTFALNFVFFIGSECALAALDELIQDTQRVAGSPTRGAVVFPTYWRARCDTISVDESRQLVAEIRKLGHTCSVDRE